MTVRETTVPRGPVTPGRDRTPWPAPARLRQRKGIGGNLFVAPALLFIVVTMAYPLVYNFYISFHDVTVGNLLSGEQPFVGLRNYAAILAEPTFRKSFLISVLFTGGSLIFQFTIGFALALFFSRPFPGSGVMRALMLLGWVLPIVVSANIWRWMLAGDYSVINLLLESVGLLDSSPYWLSQPETALFGVIMANIWVGIPFNMVLLLAGLQGIAPSLYEAARVDGAGAWQRFRYVTVPQVRPVALVVLLLGFIYTFKVFDLIFVMTHGGPVDATTVLPIHVYKLTFEFFRFGEGAAAAVILFVVSLLMSLVYLGLLRREEAA